MPILVPLPSKLVLVIFLSRTFDLHTAHVINVLQSDVSPRNHTLSLTVPFRCLPLWKIAAEPESGDPAMVRSTYGDRWRCRRRFKSKESASPRNALRWVQAG